MKRKIGLILFFILFFSPLLLVFGDESLNSAKREDVEEISPKSSSDPAVSPKTDPDIAEVVYLIKQLEREIALTNEMLDLREEDKAKAPEEAKQEPPKKSFKNSKEEALYLMEQFNKEFALTNEILYPGQSKSEEALNMLPPEGEPGGIGRVENIEITENAGPAKEMTTDMVLAKQISEEPEKTLPREDWGQMPVPPPIKKPVGKVKKEGVSQTGAVYKYSQSDLESRNYSVTIENGQTAVIFVPGLTRFFATDTNVIEASRQDSEQIAIKGINLGESFLHVWDKDGRKTIRVKVLQKGADIALEIKQRLLEAEKMESFKFRYSFDRYRLNSKSDNADRSYHYTDWIHRWGVTGETPWGMLDTKFQYQGKGYRKEDFDSDLSAWNASLMGPDLEVSVGDVGAYFSEITLPPTGYQGFRFKNPDSKDINYDMMWGARGAPMWGKKIVDFEGKNYFYGGKFGIKPADFINLRTIVMRSQGNDLETSEVVAGGGSGLTFFDGAVKLDGEYARGQHGDAFRCESNLKSDDYKFDFKGIYRDIDSDYQLVLDQDVPYRGEKGYYLKLNYYPLKFLKYTGEYNRFRNRYLPATENRHKSNHDMISTVDMDLTGSTRFSWSIWDRGRLGMNPPSKDYGQSFNLQQSFNFFKNNTSIFALYQPDTYKSPDSAASSYAERRLTIGMRMNVFKNLYLDLTELWHYRQMLETRDSGTSSSMNMGVSYSSQIFNTPFYTSLAWRYKRDTNIMSGIQILSNEKYMEWESELKYKPSSDMELYLRVDKKNIKPILDTAPTNKRDEMRIYGGGSYLFDTTLRFSNAGGAQGYVFKDLNNNGVKDTGEEGIPKIDLFAENKKNATTNERGFYSFEKLKGEETSILLDIKTLPEGYTPTTSNPQTVKLEREKIAEANFGVVAKTEISGRVFNDLNMDGELSGDDYGVQDVLLKLDDSVSDYTERGGYYTFEYVNSGERTVGMTPATIPSNLLPLSVTKKTVKVEEGKTYKEDFALYALRTIVGAVFVDKDGNGKFDSGEEGVADVEVKVGDNPALTDGMGRYFLKKLKSGSQKVEIAVESIPKGYELAGDTFRNVDLAPEGDIKEDVDFPLRKK